MKKKIIKMERAYIASLFMSALNYAEQPLLHCCCEDLVCVIVCSVCAVLLLFECDVLC